MFYRSKTAPLRHLCDIRFGFQATPLKTGTVSYLQLRHFNEAGLLNERAYDMIDFDEKSNPHILNQGDVLFAGKGNRLFAWEFKSILGLYIASSAFFVLRVNKSKILPSYLTALLNAPQYQTHLQQLGAGTNIFSIRKSELGAVLIPVPPMELQERIAAMAATYTKEINLAKLVLDKKHQLYKGVLASLLK